MALSKRRCYSNRSTITQSRTPQLAGLALIGNIMKGQSKLDLRSGRVSERLLKITKARNTTLLHKSKLASPASKRKLIKPQDESPTHKNGIIDFKDMKQWEKESSLPSKILYWLNTEFNCLKSIFKDTAAKEK